MYIKFSIYLFFKITLGLNDFDEGKSITRAIGRVGPENLDFLSPNGTRFLVAISGPQKVSIFRAQPFQCSSKLICPHQNHCIPSHINNRVH
jgi:hypothetical protein